MGGKYCVSVDCEGVACAVGVPGVGLGDGGSYAFACREAAREADAAARALFDAGAERVIVWDSHGTGVNWTTTFSTPGARYFSAPATGGGSWGWTGASRRCCS